MKPDLSQAEVDALLGEEVRTEDAVAPRDFRRPHRLGATQLASLTKMISSCLPAIERSLATQGGSDLELSLCQIDETTREAFLSSLDEDGFFVQAYDLNGETGWVHWDPRDVRLAVERSLGCGSSSQSSAPLSDLERSLAGGFTIPIAAGVASEIGCSVTAGESYVDKRLLQASVDAAPAGDNQRLSITLDVTCEAFTSKVHIYLPGVTPVEDTSAQGEAPASLPGHFDEVEVLVSAELAGLELPLQEFLDLEEGDVIALGSDDEMTARLVVDGRPAGTATWGREGDRIAMRIKDLLIESND